MADNTQANITEAFGDFEEMELKYDLLRGIYSFGFEKPSTIQQRSIMPLIKGRDTIGQAQSGTGKTGAFTIGALQRIDENNLTTQVLILAPTRELAQQICSVATGLSQHLNVRCHTCIGGTAVNLDAEKLKQGQHLVVGTPGRVYDMIQKQYLNVMKLRMFVLDEADEMLSRGFKEQIYDIFKCLPKDIQVALFSATMPTEILNITSKFMISPVEILVKSEELTLEGIRQFYVYLDTDGYKLDTLMDLYETMTITQAIIYCNSRRRVDDLAQAMHKKDFTVSCMHSDLSQSDRDLIMREFR